MIKGKDGESVVAFICDEDHLHVEVLDSDGDAVSGFVIDFSEGASLMSTLMREYGKRLGLLFVAVDAYEVFEDTIGDTKGEA